MSDKCPFCKAGVSYLAEAGEYIRYYCGSVNYHGWSRSNNCYETQITHQADLLREALEVLEVVNKGEMYVTRNSHGEFMFNSLRIADDDDLLVVSKAQALIPKIRAILEAK